MSHSKMVLNAFDSSPLSVMNHLALSKVLELALYIIHRQCDDIGKQEKKRARRTNLCTTRSCLSYDVLCSQLTTVPGTVLLLSVTRTDSTVVWIVLLYYYYYCQMKTTNCNKVDYSACWSIKHEVIIYIMGTLTFVGTGSCTIIPLVQ